MDSPYDEPVDLDGSASKDPTQDEGTVVAVVILVEIVVIVGLLLALYQRKKSREARQPPRGEGMMMGLIQGPGVVRVYRPVIFVTIGMFSGCAPQQRRARRESAALQHAFHARAADRALPPLTRRRRRRAATRRSFCSSTTSWA